MKKKIKNASISLYVPTGECFPHFVIERRMLMEALRGTESGAGQSAKSDCSVRTVARSGKCHAVGCREKWREKREGDGEEVECLIRCSSHTELRGESFLTRYCAGTTHHLTAP